MRRCIGDAGPHSDACADGFRTSLREKLVRTDGYLFQTSAGSPWDASNILVRKLNKLLDRIEILEIDPKLLAKIVGKDTTIDQATRSEKRAASLVCTLSATMPNRDSETLRKQRESCGCSVVLLCPMRHSPVCFTGMEEAQYLPSGRLTIFPSFGKRRRRPSQLRQRLVSMPVKMVGDACLWRIRHGSVRYFDLRLAPDYAESLRCGKAQAATMARSFGIFRNSA
jgi:hypothetical protein